MGIECVGIRRGYNGLINGDFVVLKNGNVAHIINRGGTMLYTARSDEFRTLEGQKKAAATCKLLGLDGIVSIGGDGSFRGLVELSKHGISVVGVPATIDNDISCTDYTIGYDTAANTAVEAIDRLRDTMQSHERCSVVEVMGRNAGHLALYVGLATGATAVLVPEKPLDFDGDVIDRIRQARLAGNTHFMIIVAEGAGSAIEIGKGIHEELGLDPRCGTIGLALSVIYRLASCGAKVVFGARREVIGQMAEERLREMGLDVRFHKLDVSSVESCREIVAFAEQTYGTVDIVVPVAAAFFARAFVDIKESEYDRIVDVDQKGQYFLVQAAARSMIRGKKGGKVVTVASVAYRGEDMPKLAMMTAYNTAKAGVVGMTRGIAKELKQYGINVNCVAPGGMVTPGAIFNNTTTAELYGPEWTRYVTEYGAGVPVAPNPDEIARMILTLCTPVSDFMYGQTVEVDGGSQFSFPDKPWSYTMEGGLHA